MRAAAVIAAIAALLGCVGCSGSGSSHPARPAPTTTSTSIPEALWLGQSDVWLRDHASSLKAISDAAKNLGDSAKAQNNNLAQIAVTQFLTTVGEADGTLPSNAFGHDMHAVFVEYANALITIRRGIVASDQIVFKQGADALAVAVADFGRITSRLNVPA